MSESQAEFRKRTESLIERMARLIWRHSTILKIIVKDIEELKAQIPTLEPTVGSGVDWPPVPIGLDLRSQREVDVAVAAITEFQRVTGFKAPGGFFVMMLK